MFHTCKNEDDCIRLYNKLKERMSPETGGQQWMLDLLTDSYILAIKTKKSDNLNLKEMLDKILIYANNRSDFDDTFFKSLKKHFESNKKFTPRQEASIKKVYEKFKLG